MMRLRVLLIDDSGDDAELVTRTLTAAGYDVYSERVETVDALILALDERVWDLAISGYPMPAFSATKALSLVRERSSDVPFIFVSTTVGEEEAVAAMKTGADDYIMKGNLARLGPAVERELRDATFRRERKRADERVAYLAYHDSLTDLPNRTLLQDRMQQAILASRREKQALTVLILDLDGFKPINDRWGHHAGDDVLRQLAARLRATLRKSDTVARLGGDEFAMLLPTTDLGGAEETARKVLMDLESPFLVDGCPLMVHGSIGIAGFPAHAASGDELLRRADAAMYVAKDQRCGYVIYAAGGEHCTEHRVALVTDLQQGIDRCQFTLDYQPILHLRTGAIVGVEALMRWDHPEQGRLLPKDFIRAAEHTGLINPLTSFALERALTDWPDTCQAVPHTVAVNLSTRSLLDRSLPDRIRELLGARPASAAPLALEVTENYIMSNPVLSTACLTELHEMGIRLVVDDFGTGYSSLSDLRKLPVDELKIDESFVMGLAGGEDDTLVRSIIDLGHNLGLTVVAEGVETAGVQGRLLDLGCDAAQGNYISRPATATDTRRWIEQKNTPG